MQPAAYLCHVHTKYVLDNVKQAMMWARFEQFHYSPLLYDVVFSAIVLNQLRIIGNSA